MKNLLLILMILISSVVYGTEPTDTIKEGSVDVEYLEKLVFKKINEYRSNYKLNQLEWDDSTSIRSRNYSKWLIDNNKFEHDGNRKTLSECIFIGGIGYSTTYATMAKAYVTNWKNSPGHNFILLMDRGCNMGGVGISLDKDTYNGVMVTFRVSGKPVIVNDPRFAHLEF